MGIRILIKSVFKREITQTSLVVKKSGFENRLEPPIIKPSVSEKEDLDKTLETLKITEVIKTTEVVKTTSEVTSGHDTVDESIMDEKYRYMSFVKDSRDESNSTLNESVKTVRENIDVNENIIINSDATQTAENKYPSLPRNHPSHKEDSEAIAKGAQLIRDLSQDKDDVSLKTLDIKENIDNNNNEDDISSDNEFHTVMETPPKKVVLSRTSSFEVIKSKTLVLDQELERTTMNIQHAEAPSTPLQAVELKIQVSPSPTQAGHFTFTRMDNDEQEMKKPPTNGDSSISSLSSSQSSVATTLERIPVASPRNLKKTGSEESIESVEETRRQDVVTVAGDGSDVTISKNSNIQWGNLQINTTRNKEIKTRITREVRVPQTVDTVVKKPPLPKRQSPLSSPTGEQNGTGNGLSEDEFAQETGLKRSNSITMDAGTQTPKIKAKSIVYFGEDGASSASEESVSDAVAKEELQREIELLKKQVESAKSGLEDFHFVPTDITDISK